MTPELVSGDSRATTEAIARQLGIENYHAEVLPEEKAVLIREGKAKGAAITMVGNGNDDAAALGEADLGIAMGEATDIASKQGVVLVDSDLRQIPPLFDLA